jgi:acetaldehyde dehydrogenase/alcohol dehydrogenase
MTTQTNKEQTAVIDNTPTPVAVLDTLIQKVKNAQRLYSSYTQKQVDEIFRAAAMAANSKRIELAKLAAQETRMGIAEDKVIKNHFASEFVFNKFKNTPTCGIIEDDETFGIKKIAEPVGILAGIIPTTNPTSTDRKSVV